MIKTEKNNNLANNENIWSIKFNNLLNFLKFKLILNMEKNKKEKINLIKNYVLKAKELENNNNYSIALNYLNKSKNLLLQNNLDLKLEGKSLLNDINNLIILSKEKIN